MKKIKLHVCLGLLVVGLSLEATAQGVSPITVTEVTISSSENGATDVFAVDVDGDGDIDILSSSYLDDTVAWYENDGNGNFTQHNISTSVNTASSVYAIDMDGDNDIDVVSVAYSDDAVYWFENNGSESFTKHTLTTTIDGPRHAFPSDLDDDDDIDIIVASSNDGKITFYENDGSESFTENTLESSISGVTSVFVINLDRKKGTDIVYAADVADEIGWLENDGSENFTKTIIASSLDGANSVFVEDVDSDGHRDIVVSISVNDEIAWFRNDGNASFIKNSLTTSADGATDVFAGDLDYDGDIDILSSSNGDDTIAWFENNGTESFAEHNISTEANGARAVFAADIGDGFGLDILSASFFDDKILYFKQTKATPKFSNLEVSKIQLSKILRQNMVSEDITENGRQDIIISSLSSNLDSSKVYILEQTGDTIFETENEIISIEGAIGSDIKVIDLDQDGDKDIVGRNSDLIFWLKNNGNGNFSQQPISSLSGTRLGIDIFDFNSDGDLDIILGGSTEVLLLDNNGSEIFSSSILANEPMWYFKVLDFDYDGDYDIAGTTYASVMWLENSGNNTFTTHKIYHPRIASSAGESVVKDLDQDGDYDIAMVTNDNLDRANVFINDGSMNFTKLTISSSLKNLQEIDTGDFDLDGSLDILITAYKGGANDKTSVHLFLNKDGVFKRHDVVSNLDVYTSYFKDMNDDGLLDIVMRSSSANTISWIKNPLHKFSFPNFSKTSISSTSTSAIATIDIDSDGDQDIVSTGVNLILNKNNGTGSFTQSTLASGLSITRDLVSIDMDGDGDIDIVTAEFSGDEISWYENDGSESFIDNDITTSVDGPIAVEVADLDQDGDWDVIAAIDNDAEFVWYENNGSESFTEHVISSSYTDPSDLKVIDVDRDGDLDIVGSSKLDHNVFWFENNGSQTFTAHSVDSYLFNANSVSVEDIDQDGDVDIIANGSSEVSMYLNNGSESFSETSLFSISILGKTMLKDIDLDGDVDVIFLNAGAEKVGWLENDGSENFKEHVVGSSLSQLVRGLSIADLNGDGKLDFISGAEGLSANISWHENNTYVDQVTLGGAVGAHWRLFSLPKSGAKLSDVSNFLNLQGIADGSNSSSDANIFTYDNSGAWEEPSSVNDEMVDGYGFAVYTFDGISDSLDIRGSEPAVDVSVSLNKSTLESGSYYTLVGNPYYSNYDLNSLTVNSGNLQDNVSFWDAKGQTYQVKDRTSNYIISPYQGFWVGVANGNSATTLTFPKTGKTDSDTSGTWLRKRNGFKGDLEFSLKTESGYQDDAIRLAVRDYALLDWDRADAGKMKPLSGSYITLAFEGTLENEQILKSVESLPNNLDGELHLSMDLNSVDVEGKATLFWRSIESLPADWQLMFYDSETEASINMREVYEYTFELPEAKKKESDNKLKVAHSGSARFKLIVSSGQSISNEQENTPFEFSLSQNYPNPFNPTTTIKYAVSEASYINLSVYNLLGQRIFTLVDENKPAGNYEVQFNAQFLSSGVYFYRMESDNFISNKKMTLIK